MKIVVLNTVLANGGDAAIAESIVDLLSEMCGVDVDVVLFDSLPELTRGQYPEWRLYPDAHRQLVAAKSDRRPVWWRKLLWMAWLVRFLGWRLQGRARVERRYRHSTGVSERIVWELASADHVVATGGTWLVPWYPLVDRLFSLLLAWSLHQPVLYMPQTCGPFTKQRVWWRFVLRRAQLIMVREDASARHLAALGVSTDKIVITPDMAWRRPQLPAIINRSDSLRIMVALRDWMLFPNDESAVAGRERYLQAVADALTHVNHDRQITLEWCSTVQGTPGYWRDDARLADDVIARLPAELRVRCHIFRQSVDPAEFQLIAQSCDLVLSSRMHVAILAWQVGVPVVPILNERKMDALLVQMGAADLATHLHSVTGVELSGALSRAIDRLEDLRRSVPLAATKLHRAAVTIDQAVRGAWSIDEATLSVNARTRGQIMVVVPIFPKRSETFVLEPLAFLQQMGWQISVTARRSANDDIKHSGLAVYHTDAQSVQLSDENEAKLSVELNRLPQQVRGVFEDHWPIGALRGIAAQLLSNPPDVLYCHFGQTGLAVSAVCAALELPIPIVTAFYGFDFSQLLRQGGDNMYDHLIARGSAFVTVCDYAKKKLLQIGLPTSSTYTVRSGFDASSLKWQPRALSRSGRIHIGSVSRLTAKKGVDDALRAVARLLDEYPDLHYTVIGDGEERDALRRLAASLNITHAVTWLGERTHEEVNNLMREVDILLVPSRQASDGNEEGIPVVIIEGMAIGVPVVTTNHSGIPELVTLRTGWVARQGDPIDLARVLRRVLRISNYRRRSIVRAARQVVERDYTFEAHVEAIDHLLMNAMSSYKDLKRM